ncbi:hypothetical protein [Peribacillus deserti]|uniref:hypothetical protein n=1 Tax=Peribacillus deserti TaxID=673318 RepID=UPI00215235AA|nr:hypothetical protein [Peribacillus deserti]
MNVLKNNGFKFLGFLHISEFALLTYQPLAGSFAIIACNGKFLIVITSGKANGKYLPEAEKAMKLLKTVRRENNMKKPASS